MNKKTEYSYRIGKIKHYLTIEELFYEKGFYEYRDVVGDDFYAFALSLLVLELKLVDNMGRYIGAIFCEEDKEYTYDKDVHEN